MGRNVEGGEGRRPGADGPLMAWRGTTVSLLGIIAPLVLGCGLGSRGDPPPSPSAAFEPALVEAIVAMEAGTLTNSVHLANGLTFSLPYYSSTRLRNGSGVLQPGDLLIAGPGNPPAWWVDLEPRLLNRSPGATGPETVPDVTCWLIEGGAIDEGDAIHYSTGLVLKKAEGFHVVETWIPDPFPARDSDSFCVDRAGHVRTLEFIWEPF
jgi:hypothetical protein